MIWNVLLTAWIPPMLVYACVLVEDAGEFHATMGFVAIATLWLILTEVKKTGKEVGGKRARGSP